VEISGSIIVFEKTNECAYNARGVYERECDCECECDYAHAQACDYVYVYVYVYDYAHAQACDEDDKRGGLFYIFFAGVTRFGRGLKVSQHPAQGLILWSKNF